MKLKFLTIKKKAIIAFLLCIFTITIFCATYFSLKVTASPKSVYTIVIDAGHGGKDGGAVGKQTEVTESYLNLQYALTLKKICLQFGFNVVMTRSDMSGLYSPLAKNKKKSEMEKRKQIIEKSKADFVVSIHMNSFPNSEARGSQVFYDEDSEGGHALAQAVQESLYKNIDYSKKTPKVADYYILKCSDVPSVLIECGFLSNSDEEILLQKNDYMQNFCYSVFCGILMYFEY